MQFVPSSLAHHTEGTPRDGHGRSARGLLLSGMVVDVHLPGDPGSQLPTGAEASEVLIDVYILDQGYRTIMYDVPLLLQSGGVLDHETWVPTPTTGTVSGQPLVLSPEGSGVTPTPGDDMNGDRVLIGFQADDLNKPICLGQLAHPRNTEKPRHPTAPFRYRRTVAGTDFNIDQDGIVSWILQTGTLAQMLADTASDPEQVLRGDTFLSDLNTTLTKLSASLAEISGILNALGLLTPITAAQTLPQIAAMQTSIATSQSDGHPYLATRLSAD